MEWLFWVTFFLSLMLLISGVVIPIYRNHIKATGGVVNYDPLMRKFVYKVDLSSAEILDLLKTQNVKDELCCTLDSNRSILKCADCGANLEYHFYILSCGDFSILRLEQIPLIVMQNHIPYKLNAFMAGKLQAEGLPFSKYGF